MEILIPVALGFIGAGFSIREWVDEHITIGSALVFAFVILIIALFAENKKKKSELEELNAENEKLKDKEDNKE